MVNAQKNQLISETLRVAQKLGQPEAVREKLQGALNEREFSRAVETIKDAIPESLLVDSQNPLKLLHDALSIGVHQESDSACLAAAHAIRLVLLNFQNDFVSHSGSKQSFGLPLVKWPTRFLARLEKNQQVASRQASRASPAVTSRGSWNSVNLPALSVLRRHSGTRARSGIPP